MSQPVSNRQPLALHGYSQLILDQLECGNVFLVSLDGEPGWYRYHGLFQTFLRARMATEAPGLLAELHRRARAWLEQNALWAEAQEHARAAGDSSYAAAPAEPSTLATVRERQARLAFAPNTLELAANERAPLTATLVGIQGSGSSVLDDLESAASARAQFHQPLGSHGPAGEHRRLRALPRASRDGPPLLVEALSERECEVLRLIAGGASNQAVAQALFISLGTVKSHINHILGKLAASNRTEAVAHARDLGLLDR